MIFHIARTGDWQHAQVSGVYTMSTVGKTLAEEGFIHCSDADQVSGTAERYYKDETDLVLLHIDTAKLTSPVKYENGFPHVYGPIDVAAVSEAEPFRS